jgi:hypothetical protein
METGVQRLLKHPSAQWTGIPNWVVRDPNYSPNAFRLLAYLLSHEDGYELTYQQIERQTTLGRYAINQAANFLVSEGWVILKRNKGADGRYLAKTWILKDPRATEDDSTADDCIVESFHSGTANGHIEDHLLEKTTNKRRTLSKSEYESLFDEFWKEYPRKLDKGAAFRAFKSALKRAKFEDILAGAIAYRNDPTRKPEFTKYPATWLNADAWENAANLPEVKAANEARRAKEKEQSDAFLREQEEIAKQSVLLTPELKKKLGL